MAHDRCKPLQGSSACRRSGGRQAGQEPYQGKLNTKIHLAVDAHGMPLRTVITEDTRADCKEPCAVIDGFAAEALSADQGFDTDAVIEEATRRDVKVVIPPKKVAKRNETTTDVCIKYATLLRMPFHISKGGVKLQPVMQKEAIFSCCRPNQMHVVMSGNNLTTLLRRRWSCLPSEHSETVRAGAVLPCCKRRNQRLRNQPSAVETGTSRRSGGK